MNQCSQCAQRGKLCRKCRTFLCHDHYHSHSCMIDRTTHEEDRADEIQRQNEQRDLDRIHEQEVDEREQS